MPRSSISISERLTEAREAAGLTIAEAARRAAVAERTLQSWEAGKATPRPNKLQMLAGVLSVPMLWLLSGDAAYEANTSHVSRIDELDGKVRRLEELVGKPCALVSTSPEREDVILMRDPFEG